MDQLIKDDANATNPNETLAHSLFAPPPQKAPADESIHRYPTLDNGTIPATAAADPPEDPPEHIKFGLAVC